MISFVSRFDRSRVFASFNFDYMSPGEINTIKDFIAGKLDDLFPSDIFLEVS